MNLSPVATRSQETRSTYNTTCEPNGHAISITYRNLYTIYCPPQFINNNTFTDAVLLDIVTVNTDVYTHF